jgi:transcriptional regulator with XRE-family HTH domain
MTNWAGIVCELEALGWSLTGLGRAIGLSPQAVSDIKQGRTKAPSGMAAVRLHQIHERGEAPPAADAQEAPHAA